MSPCRIAAACLCSAATLLLIGMVPGVAPVPRDSGQKSIGKTVPLPDGTCALLTLDPASGSTVKYLRDGAAFTELMPIDYRIRLRYLSFDPVEAVSAPPAGLAAAPESRLYFVQFVVPPLPPLRAHVESLGGRVLAFQPHCTLVAWLPPESRAALQQEPFVRWIGPVHPAFKLDASLLEAASGGRLTEVSTYVVALYERGAAAQARVAGQVNALGGVVRGAAPEGFCVEADLSAGQALALSRLDDVQFIDPLEPPEVDESVWRELSGATYLQSTLGFSGQGVRGEVLDVGIDPNHSCFDPKPLIHGAAPPGSFHGTAVYGILFCDGAGDPNARGMLPDEEQGIFAYWPGITNAYQHTAELLDPAGPYRAVFQTSSVGSPQTSAYTTISATIDDLFFVNDLVRTQSSGNTGGPSGRPESFAKNIISVGGISAKNTLPREDDSCGAGGPSLPDGRVKPDVAHVYDNFVAPSQDPNGYTTFAGTSASTAVAAGCAGLLMQLWHQEAWAYHGGQATVFDSRPRAATLRALLFSTAYRYPSSQGNLKRSCQGWGMPNVAAAYDERARTYIVNEQHLIGPLQTNAYVFNITNPAAELRATLVYKDPKGNPASSVARINDLTLRVTSPGGTTYWGNFGLLNGDFSLPGGAPDTTNVVENVLLTNPPAGAWKVEVIAAEINEDGHLATPQTDAAYALVVYGKDETPVGCPGDITLDGKVDQADLGVLLAAYGTTVGQPQYNGQADLNADGAVDQADLGALLSHYDKSCG